MTKDIWCEFTDFMLPALNLESKFKFLCHTNIECFNRCCYDLNLFLTPYDVLRLKKNLKMSSTQFLKKYTTWHIGINTGLPVVVLKMRDDLTCPFVSEGGCTVYKDRPSSCRLYPLARVKVGDKEYYYLVKENHCKGFEENRVWTVKEWLEDQEVEVYNKMNDLFMELIVAKQKIFRDLTNDEIELIYLLFDIDKFREFASDVLTDKELDDEELLVFGIKWMKEKIFNA